ncbi:hypothetical protein KUW00_04970 [Halomonas sp. DP5N14-9]|uniref:hypothetical protein n=1 Tax=Halomonas sp. DP5N14-9 TaxID=2859075 RepID=UPI001C9A13CD|nr:hypothetical protein [Halomonas sp. DP5N14-9]MBY5940238.1 hypothetical protein [Halomonas sp. DP5N14-9]
MKQRVELTLERISTVARDMVDQDEVERAQSFATIKVMLDWLRDTNRDYNHNNICARENLDRIEGNIAVLAGLEAGGDTDEPTLLAWVYGDVDSAGSELALGAIESD